MPPNPRTGTIPELLAKVEANGDEVWSAGPQPEAAIEALETRLGVRLPPSFRRFVAEYGGMSIHDSTVSGIVGDPFEEGTGSLHWDTMNGREEWSLPQHLLVIEADDDAPHCLDTRRVTADGEFPVVCYELHSKAATKVADSFDEWVRTFYLHWADPE